MVHGIFLMLLILNPGSSTVPEANGNDDDEENDNDDDDDDDVDVSLD